MLRRPAQNQNDEQQYRGGSGLPPRRQARRALMPAASTSTCQAEGNRARRRDPGVLHGAFFAKYAVTFLGFRRASSATRSPRAASTTPSARASSAWRQADDLSRISRLHPVARGLRPSLVATGMSTSRACLTARSLNSSVYSCFGIFSGLVLPVSILAIDSWKTKNGGQHKVSVHEAHPEVVVWAPMKALPDTEGKACFRCQSALSGKPAKLRVLPS